MCFAEVRNQRSEVFNFCGAHQMSSECILLHLWSNKGSLNATFIQVCELKRKMYYSIAHYSYTNICWRYLCEHFTLFDQTWIYTWNLRLSKRCVFRILPGSYFLTFQSRARAPSQGAHRRSREKMQLEGQWGPAWLQWLVPALSNGPMLERAWWCSPLKRAIWRRNNNHPMRLYILVVSYLLNSCAGCMHPSLPCLPAMAIHDIGTPNAG